MAQTTVRKNDLQQNQQWLSKELTHDASESKTFTLSSTLLCVKICPPGQSPEIWAKPWLQAPGVTDEDGAFKFGAFCAYL